MHPILECGCSAESSGLAPFASQEFGSTGSAFVASIVKVWYRATKKVAAPGDRASSMVRSVHSARFPSTAVRLPGSPGTKETESVFSQKILQRPNRLFAGTLQTPCHETPMPTGVLPHATESTRLRSCTSGIAEEPVSYDSCGATRNRVGRTLQDVGKAGPAMSISCSMRKKILLNCVRFRRQENRNKTVAALFPEPKATTWKELEKWQHSFVFSGAKKLQQWQCNNRRLGKARTRHGIDHSFRSRARIGSYPA